MKKQANTNHGHLLCNLLAIIHRDGGHYISKHGLDKAVKDAIMIVTAERVLLSDYEYAIKKGDIDEKRQSR